MLTDTKIRKAKSRDKVYTLPDNNGLSLEVNPKSGKYWRMRCTLNGKRKLLSLGVYPAVSLSDARAKRDKHKQQIAKGINPTAAKQQKQQEKRNSYTLAKLLKEWHDYHYQDLSQDTRKRTMRSLELYIVPWLGKEDIKELTPPTLLQCLRRVESQQKLETANRLKSLCGQAFRYGVRNGYCERDRLKRCVKNSTCQAHAYINRP